MAFSFGFINYTISKVIDTFEDFADDVVTLNPEKQNGETAVQDAVASEVFALVNESTENNLKVSPPSRKEGTGHPVPDIPESIDMPPVTSGKRIVVAEVTEFFLRYAYDIDDIPNTRLRFDAPQNLADIFEKKHNSRDVESREDARKKRDLKYESRRDDER